MEQFNLNLPKIIFGAGSRLELQVQVESAHTVLLVVGENALTRKEPAKLLEQLSRNTTLRILQREVKPEPAVEDTVVHFEEIDLVVGIGGGSVLDVAKVIGAYLKVPKIGLPTTAGSGSEVTSEVVLKVDGKKKSMRDDNYRFSTVLVDPELTHTMSPNLTLATGIDAIAHCVESWHSRKGNQLTELLAAGALTLLLDNVESAMRNSKLARNAMSIGSLLAGVCVNLSGTTLGHALSYPLSNRGIPHGRALATVLPSVTMDPKIIRLCRMLPVRWNNQWDIEEVANEVMEDERHLHNYLPKVRLRDVIGIYEGIRNESSNTSSRTR